MDELDEFKATYFEECNELLIDLEEQFSAIEEGDRDTDRLHAVFRGIHSIKGGAGAFNFSGLVSFSHSYETLLDHVRDGRIELTDEVVTLCIRSNDVVADFVTAAQEGAELDQGYGAEEKAKFDALCNDEKDDADGDDFVDFVFNPIAVDLGREDAAEPANDLASGLNADNDLPDFAPVEVTSVGVSSENDSFEISPLGADESSAGWKIHFTPHPVLFQRANDPLLLLRELGELGQANVAANMREIPSMDDFEPYGVYCSWTVTLTQTSATEEDVREVFEFVDGDCDLDISPLSASSADAMPVFDIEPIAILPISELEPVLEMTDEDETGLDLLGLLAEDEAETKMPAPVAAPDEPMEAAVQSEKDTSTMQAEAELDSLIGLAEQTVNASTKKEPAKTEAAPKVPADKVGTEKKKSTGQKAAATMPSIRVDLDKVDRVVNMVGELVITQSMLTQQMDDHLRENYQEMVRGLEVLAQTTRSLQDAVMAIRAQPVKSVFQRMPRLVRELAGKTGKKIKLEMVGEATEIDKTIIEQLSDPLTHMIRNSADHGIESPETRASNGKDETGTITLSAEQAGGNILITIQDDGAGINREKVTELAVERGVIPPDHQLNEEEVDNLIFAPGFSTVTEVSDISGRGVGMDVVLQNIKKIGGSVLIKSEPGRGTRMTLRLPLTLAVLEVMLVNVAGSPYVLPLGSIVETIQCARAEFGRVPSGDKVLKVRGDYVQVIEVDTFFGVESEIPQEERFVVLCEAEGSKKVALMVDSIIGQQQVVIKSLEENFARIIGVAGGTILGDGSVALIVDVQGLKNYKEQTSRETSAAA